MSETTNAVPAAAVSRDWETWIYQQTAGLVRFSLLPWFLFAFVGLMAFDAPGSEHDPWVWSLVVPVWCYPLTAGIGGMVAWYWQHRGQTRRATLALCCPPVFTALTVTLVITLSAWFPPHNNAGHRNFEEIAKSLK